MGDARKTAVELLSRVERDGAYSNLALDRAFSEETLSPRERAFAAALFYGVLERKMTLDYLIRAYSKTEFDQLDPSVILLLRAGLYQLLYMESVPERAAVHETVALAEPCRKGFVNAVLRSFLRDGGVLKTDSLEGEARLSVEYSCPKWLVKMWTKRFGEERTRLLLKASLGPPAALYPGEYASRVPRSGDRVAGEGRDRRAGVLVAARLRRARACGRDPDRKNCRLPGRAFSCAGYFLAALLRAH